MNNTITGGEKQMRRCVAIYPQQLNEEYVSRVKKTIELAARYGFREVFTTLHLPEYRLDMQLDCLAITAKQAKEKGLEVTVDIGGPFIAQILNDKKNLLRMKDIAFDFLRLDYGYSLAQVGSLYKELSFDGFVINASIYDEEEIDRQIEAFRRLDPKIRLRACHNFYPRAESGLEEGFAIRQDSYFKKHDIPICYSVPSYSDPRGPLHQGLCTIEKHRYAPLREIICDLCLNYQAEAILMADEWLSEEEFREVYTTLVVLNEHLDKTVKIKVVFEEGVSQKEKDIVLGKHCFRYDSSSAILRSKSSRQMAEYASEIEVNNTIRRDAGAITIDNRLYKRYSGELQVVLKNKEADERVNVAARIKDPDDLIRLRRFKEGTDYLFAEE